MMILVVFLDSTIFPRNIGWPVLETGGTCFCKLNGPTSVHFGPLRDTCLPNPPLRARCSMHATTHHAQTTHTNTDFAFHVLLGV